MYSHICSYMPRLCPRPLPSRLKGVGLARLAQLNPLILGVFNCSDKDIVEFKNWIASKKRRNCAYCGAFSHLLDDEYVLIQENNRIVLVITDVKPICRRCYMAKHIDDIRDYRLLAEALERLSRINTIPLDAVKRLVDEALSSCNKLGKDEVVVYVDVEASWSHCVSKLMSSLIKLGARVEASSIKVGEATRPLYCIFPGIDGYRELLRGLNMVAREEALFELSISMAMGAKYTPGVIVANVRESNASKAIHRVLDYLAKSRLRDISVEIVLPEYRPISIRLRIGCIFDQQLLEEAIKFLEVTELTKLSDNVKLLAELMDKAIEVAEFKR